MFPRMFDDQWAVEVQFKMLANSGWTNGLMMCPIALWPSTAVGQDWTLIYQHAFDRVVQAITPSAFQQTLEPSRN